MREIKMMVETQDSKAMGAQAKFEREMRNLLQADVAKKMGITQAHLSGLEHGRCLWSKSMMKKFNNAVR